MERESGGQDPMWLKVFFFLLPAFFVSGIVVSVIVVYVAFPDDPWEESYDDDYYGEDWDINANLYSEDDTLVIYVYYGRIYWSDYQVYVGNERVHPDTYYDYWSYSGDEMVFHIYDMDIESDEYYEVTIYDYWDDLVWRDYVYASYGWGD
ncbi:MAG: hypothetical protein ACMUIE_00220 [Thermoplasmatota archaeon]